jgi:poly(hydroxyalkanoate) granule-associated protein
MATRKSGSRSRRSTAQSTASASSDATKAITDSAQKIWLAGLGAFERARAEGPRMFDSLVDQGKTLGGQARDAADQALRTLRDTASDAGGRFDKLEQVFEERVARSLRRLGVLTREEVTELNQGVRDLADQVRELMAQQQGTAQRAAGSTRGSARKASRAGATAARKTARSAKRTAKAAKRGSRARRA